MKIYNEDSLKMSVGQKAITQTYTIESGNVYGDSGHEVTCIEYLGISQCRDADGIKQIVAPAWKIDKVLPFFGDKYFDFMLESK